MVNGLSGFTLLGKDLRQAIMRLRISRFDLDGPRIMENGLLNFQLLSQDTCQIAMGLGIIRVDS